MKFTQLHLFLNILDEDIFVLCNIEFHALKAFFSTAGNEINIETDDENDEVRPKKYRSNVHNAEDCDSSLF